MTGNYTLKIFDIFVENLVNNLLSTQVKLIQPFTWVLINCDLRHVLKHIKRISAQPELIETPLKRTDFPIKLQNYLQAPKRR